MNYFKSLFSVCAVLALFSCSQQQRPETNVLDESLTFADQQFSNAMQITSDPNKIPRTLDKNRDLTTVGIYNWTSGFFAGNLWYMYKLTGEEKWKNEAVRWTEALDTIQYWSGNHDVGFMIGDSYGLGIRFDNRKQYEPVMVQTAESLCKRFNETTQCLESWNYRKAWDGKTEWFFPVIIDNMMNLELLFEASKISGNQRYYDVAVTHANTTMKNHYRPDYSCYHVVDYDEKTGEVKDKATCQGFTDESSWARGQAWGLYGYVLCYRYTKDAKYLDFAEKIASFILDNPRLPKDLVPYWDYNANMDGWNPEWKYNKADYPVIPRDASAAAITSSALFELATYVTDKGYREKATDMLMSLANNYKADPANNKYFILDHSVGSLPHSAEIDVPLVYADYYFLEAIDRYRNM
ncbi:glucuronyl hydrolase [Puteibacter caeruleilacunae]|nr:glucuronyl hydrolase [Puteibacter caeruleilacunae]